MVPRISRIACMGRLQNHLRVVMAKDGLDRPYLPSWTCSSCYLRRNCQQHEHDSCWVWTCWMCPNCSSCCSWCLSRDPLPYIVYSCASLSRIFSLKPISRSAFSSPDPSTCDLVIPLLHLKSIDQFYTFLCCGFPLGNQLGQFFGSHPFSNLMLQTSVLSLG